jgi:hypothetical protein
MHRLPLKLALLSAAFLATQSAQADPIVAGSTFLAGTAIQDITLLANSAFNPTGSDVTFQISGVGGIMLNRDAQVGSTITISTASGLFTGFNPNIGGYTFGSIPPLTPSNFGGSITNVVQNPNDPGFATGQASSFVSGNLTFGGASFGLAITSGPAAGAMLYTDPAVPFSFSSTLDGLPPSDGTVLASTGTDALNILFNGQVVGYSSNRRIILSAAVPEPSSLMLSGAAITTLACLARLRRRTI